ncbi:MAG: VOC family protein [Oscillospiraceae bacterium]|nr:VOC family protein [Oscillospiraceae bacterium]
MMRFDAVGLFVTDVTKSSAFYRDVIGMKTDWDGKEPNAELKADGFRLIMYGRDDFEKMTSYKFGYPNGTNGTMELAYEVESFAAVDREYERVVGLGAVPIMPPTTEPWGQRTSYVADPDGNLIEIGSFKE